MNNSKELLAWRRETLNFYSQPAVRGISRKFNVKEHSVIALMALLRDLLGADNRSFNIADAKMLLCEDEKEEKVVDKILEFIPQFDIEIVDEQKHYTLVDQTESLNKHAEAITKGSHSGYKGQFKKAIESDNYTKYVKYANHFNFKPITEDEFECGKEQAWNQYNSL